MKKLALVIGMVFVAAMPAVANVIWSEDFSSVSDWSVIWNPSNDATVVSDGGQGFFSEPSPGLGWPNGPAFGPTNRITFDPLLKSDFTFSFTATAISNSMSFDFGLDCFSNGSYVATVWDVFPNQAFTGTTNINLGAFSFDPIVTHVTPKLTLHTGDGDQTVTFDSMEMDQQVIPEPGSVALIVVGGFAAVLLRKRSR
jgi:hypothetical protein